MKYTSRFYILSIAISIFFGCTFSISTASAEAEEQYWTSLQVTKLLADSPWRIGMEGNYRYSKTRENTIVQSFRTSIGYRLESGTVLTFIHETRAAASDKDNETRLIVQGTHRFSFEDIDLGLRLRHEHRLFQDSKVWMHRTRGQARVGLKALQFSSVTPFVANETQYIWNTVAARQAGSLEVRSSIGGSIKVSDNFNLDIAYMDRRTYVDSIETRFQVAQLAMSCEF